MKYFAYIRRSSEDKKKQVQSIPKQYEWCREKAAKRGIEIVEFFEDIKTGKEPGRPGFQKLMEAIEKAPEPIGVICWKINRLARNPIDEGAVKYAFMRGKIKHILASDREYREGESQIIMGVDFGSATQYSIDLSKDVTEGMQKKNNKGWRPTYAPLGYINDPYGLKGERKVFPDPERYPLIKEAWEMFLTGAYTVPDIKKMYDHAGLTTRNNRPVSLSVWYAIFTNSFYCGEYVWSKETIIGNHDAMISPQEFDLVQSILGRKGKPRQGKHDHAFTGFIRCACCGCMITAEPPKIKRNPKTKEIRVYNYMRCTKKNKNKKCDQKCIRIEALEAQIDEVLASVEIPEAFVKWAFGELHKEAKEKTNELSHKRGELQRAYNDNEAMIDELAQKLAKGVISDDIYKRSEETYKKTRHRLEQEIKEYGKDKDHWLKQLEETFTFASTARVKFATDDPQTKREIFRRLGSNFYLEEGKLSIELEKPFFVLKKALEKTKLQFPRIELKQTRSHKGLNGPLIEVWSA